MITKLILETMDMVMDTAMDTAMDMDMVEATDTMKKIKNHNQKVNY